MGILLVLALLMSHLCMGLLLKKYDRRARFILFGITATLPAWLYLLS